MKQKIGQFICNLVCRKCYISNIFLLQHSMTTPEPFLIKFRILCSAFGLFIAFFFDSKRYNIFSKAVYKFVRTIHISLDNKAKQSKANFRMRSSTSENHAATSIQYDGTDEWIPWKVKQGRPQSIPGCQNTDSLSELAEHADECPVGEYCYYYRLVVQSKK